MALFPETPKYSPKIGTFVISKTLDIHIFFNYLEHAMEISYNSEKNLSNSVSYASIRDHLIHTIKGFRVKNQIPNLTLGLSCDHNSCILGLNEQCKLV